MFQDDYDNMYTENELLMNGDGICFIGSWPRDNYLGVIKVKVHMNFEELFRKKNDGTRETNKQKRDNVNRHV